MKKAIWHSFQGRGSHASLNPIIGALANAGVQTHVLEEDLPRGPGIIFFDEITPSLCIAAREISCGGRERLLAIALRQPVNERGIWDLLASGVSDIVVQNESSNWAHKIALRLERWHAVDDLLDSSLITENLVGQSTKWRSVLRQIIEVARYTDASMLVGGESGTGKELVARLVHTLDQRSRKSDLVVLDCSTVTPTLSGSEFFGHERGAFTGAVTSRDGAFALADQGTLFLDEVGELPLELQAQLLRVVQEKTFKRVGGNNWQKTDFRLICATNRELLDEVKKGKFRNDLYYRIAAWTCRLPPLRERREDIVPLARHFMRQMAPHEEPPEIDKRVEEYLVRRDYPGNVRDLRQLVMRIMYRHVGKGLITVGDIPEDERPSSDFMPFNWCDETFESSIRSALQFGVGLKEIGRTAEDTAVRIAVRAEDNNLQRAAKRLGVTDRALQLRRAARQNERYLEQSSAG